MDVAISYLDLIIGLIDTARTELVIAAAGILIWVRIGLLGRSLKAQQEKNFARAELFVATEHGLHERLEAILTEIRQLKSR